jgi:protein gp37
MSDKSAIEWLDGGSTWNPVRGCTPCAPECANCYARTVPDALDLPLRWRKPRTIFVNSMSDLFHPDVPDAYVLRVVDVIRECVTPSDHRFILLTKRGARMRDFFLRLRWDGDGEGRLWLSDRPASPSGFAPPGDGYALARALTNLTVGVSVGTRARLSEIDHLRATPAARRMISFEPLLEDLGDVDLRGIDFAAIGGESGHGARPCNVAWIRSLVKRCRAAGCAPFVKQLGARIEDRNDAGFDGAEPDEWPEHIAAEDRIEHDRHDTGYQGAPVRIRTRHRKGADPAEWPADLRVREFPEVCHG